MQADFNSSLWHSAKFKAIVFATRMKRRWPASLAKSHCRINDTSLQSIELLLSFQKSFVSQNTGFFFFYFTVYVLAILIWRNSASRLCAIVVIRVFDFVKKIAPLANWHEY